MSEVFQRHNALTEHLNNIARINAQHGTRAEGGAGAPIVREEPPAVAGGVSLPPPTMLSAEEEAELQAAWAAEQEARRVPHLEPVEDRLMAGEFLKRENATQNLAPARGSTLTDFVAFDLRRGVVIADNGEEFTIPEGAVKELKGFAFNLSVQVLNSRMVALAQTLGIKLAVPEAKNGAEGTPTPAEPAVPSKSEGEESGLVS